ARISLHDIVVRRGRARPAAIPSGKSPARHGWLARLLAVPPSDVLRNTLRRARPRPFTFTGRIRLLLRIRYHPEGVTQLLQFSFRDRDGAHQVSQRRCKRPYLPFVI